MERALSGLVPLRRSAGSFGPLRLNTKDARRSVDRYLQLVRLYPKSSLADDSLYRAARLRGQILRDKAGAQELLQQILKKYPSSNTAKDASSYLATLSPKEKRQSPSAASKASKQKQPRANRSASA